MCVLDNSSFFPVFSIVIRSLGIIYGRKENVHTSNIEDKALLASVAYGLINMLYDQPVQFRPAHIGQPREVCYLIFSGSSCFITADGLDVLQHEKRRGARKVHLEVIMNRCGT